MKRIILLCIFMGLVILGHTQTTLNFTLTVYLDGNEVADIADAGDYLWLVASNNTTVIKFDKSTGTGTSFDFNDFNIQYGDWIIEVECDESGIPYVGTFAGSFKMSDDNAWLSLKSRPTGGIAESKEGGVWISYNDELWKYKGNTASVIDLNSQVFHPLITSMAEDNEQNLWVIDYNILAFYGDLVKFNGQNWMTYHMPEYYNEDFFVPESGFPKINLKYQFSINDIKVDKYNKIWISKTKRIPNSELVRLSNGGGVYPTKSELVSFKDSSWAAFNPPVQTRINSIAPDNKSIWCGTNNGLMQFNNSQWTVFDAINSELPSLQVNSLVIGSDGVMWLGTNKGLVSFNKNELKTPAKPEHKLVSEIELFPNPANDFITLKIPVELQNSTVDILNTQGQTVKTFSVNKNNSRLDVRFLPEGIYLVRFQSDENFVTKRFVKQQ